MVYIGFRSSFSRTPYPIPSFLLVLISKRETECGKKARHSEQRRKKKVGSQRVIAHQGGDTLLLFAKEDARYPFICPRFIPMLSSRSSHAVDVHALATVDRGWVGAGDPPDKMKPAWRLRFGGAPLLLTTVGLVI